MGSYGRLVKFLLVSGQRREKVASMRWEDINGDTWTVATEVREKGNAGVLDHLPISRSRCSESAGPKVSYSPDVAESRSADGQSIKLGSTRHPECRIGCFTIFAGRHGRFCLALAFCLNMPNGS